MSDGIEVDMDMTDEQMSKECYEALQDIDAQLTKLLGTPLRSVFFLAVPVDGATELCMVGAGTITTDAAKAIAWLQSEGEAQL